jgi:hypothetical protein
VIQISWPRGSNGVSIIPKTYEPCDLRRTKRRGAGNGRIFGHRYVRN